MVRFSILFFWGLGIAYHNLTFDQQQFFSRLNINKRNER